ncbi:muscarinic acetylcholine receptor M1-like [Glandiceps talaboti]
MEAGNLSEVNGTVSSDLHKWLTQTQVIVIVTVICIVSLVTIAGNLLTIIAFGRDRKLQLNISNWYLVNLACADLLIGCISFPLDALLFAYELYWPFGEIVCKIFLTVDLAATWGSITAVILISLDRYMLLTRELQYKMFQTRRKALLQCSICWSVVSIVTIFLAWIYPLLATENFDYSYTCDAEFLYKSELAIVYTVISCFIPLTLLVYLNTSVYINVYRRTRRKHPPHDQGVTRQRTEDEATEKEKLPKQTVLPTVATVEQKSNGNYTSVVGKSKSVATSTASSNKVRSNGNKDRRHVKTAKSLAILVMAYLLCWAPYNIALIVSVFCPSYDCVSSAVWNVSIRLLYFNSTINPFLYALCNLRFRQNFKDMLCRLCVKCKK